MAGSRSPMEQGYKAHGSGLLLAECPYLPRNGGRLRRLWRAGWMQREEAACRASGLDIRRRAGLL